MSFDTAMTSRRPLPWRRRPAALLAIAAARLLASRSPHHLSRVLHLARRGAAPATAAQARAAREAVVATSRRCATDTACLQRSLATALLCRLRGTWPTWCTGVRTRPFTAHAWIETDGHPIGEPPGTEHYVPTLTVPPPHRR